MRPTTLKAIKNHQPRLGVEARRVVLNFHDMTRLPGGQERKKCGNVPSDDCVLFDFRLGRDLNRMDEL